VARTIAQPELQNSLAKVIDAVAAGESFVITRNGEPVAELRPIDGVRRTFVPRAEVAEFAVQGPHIDALLFRQDQERISNRVR
jgi:prevent-host-death family protein